jgi:hypothetical protein
MRRPLDQTRLLKELGVVADKLSGSTLTREQRMVLLQRQAELGDLRDAIAMRARRAAAR